MGNNVRQGIEALRQFLISLPRPTKTLVVVTTDLVGFCACGLFAFWLLSYGQFDPVLAIPVVGIAVLASTVVAWRHDLYRAVVRYMGVDLLVAGTVTATVAAIVGGAVYALDGEAGMAFRWAIAYWAFTNIYICCSRYFARLFLVTSPARSTREKVIIFGAGAAGAQLAISLQGADDFVPVAMVDDDPILYGKMVKGLTVYPTSQIESLTKKTGATRILLAIPAAGHRRRRRVLERLSKFPLHVQTVPDIKHIISGKARVDDIRDVDVKDLLGRDPVPPIPELFDACIKGKNVMVTGAGGSIGSELCRQILKLEPARLILFELSEAALYAVDQNIRKLACKRHSRCEVVALLGSVHHENRIREVMKTFRIQTVYHAAAYKHVPIVEQNLFEGIHNNVFGAFHTMRAAIDGGVETFVLVSTDKAVNPTSVMGATKRFAELVLQAYNTREHNTRMCMVRFGNVLESSGSVVPLFREQIRAGGPVTVTHRDIIRYFMTIPEAAQLVIQAGSMARGGDVFVLDMGKPVRIHDLAHRMINLMGLTVREETNPDGDIEIQYIGLRPAEKLYEELLIGANVTGTEHPRILRADEEFLSFDALSRLLEELNAASQALDYDKARNILLSAVKEYEPPNGIDDLVWLKKTGTDTGGTVVDLWTSGRKPGNHDS